MRCSCSCCWFLKVPQAQWEQMKMATYSLMTIRRGRTSPSWARKRMIPSCCHIFYVLGPRGSRRWLKTSCQLMCSHCHFFGLLKLLFLLKLTQSYRAIMLIMADIFKTDIWSTPIFRGIPFCHELGDHMS